MHSTIHFHNFSKEVVREIPRDETIDAADVIILHMFFSVDEKDQGQEIMNRLVTRKRNHNEDYVVLYRDVEWILLGLSMTIGPEFISVVAHIKPHKT